jgi:hypothetical protein
VCAEKDFGLWLPVTGGSGLGPPTELLFFHPYLWVDKALALVAGREIFGFSKGLASLTRPRVGGASSWYARGLACERFGPGPNNEWRTRRLFSVSSAAPFTGGVLSGVAGLLALLGSVTVGGVGLSLGLLAPMLTAANPTIPFVYLKQFRSVSDPLGACYQAVTESNNQLLGAPSVSILSGAHVARFPRFDSLDMAGTAGIPVDAQRKVAVLAAFRMEFAFRVEAGKVVFRA